MRTRRAFKPLSLLLFLSLMAAGCGEGKLTCPDTVSPIPVTDLSATAPSDTSIVLTWTAPGDDGDRGRASAYDVRYSTEPDTAQGWWESDEVIDNPPEPKNAGGAETLSVEGLIPDTPYYFALKTADEVPNWSLLSNVAICTTLAKPDLIPPAAVTDLTALGSRSVSIALAWTATGDDSLDGRASGYDLRYSTIPPFEQWWSSAAHAAGPAEPLPMGAIERYVVPGLTPDTKYYFALKVRDDAMNWSPLSNFADATTSKRTYPQLLAQSSAFGIRYWTGWNMFDIEEYEVTLGSLYELTISADASWYGGFITGISYGWDLTDLESEETDPEGNRAWTPWSTGRRTVLAHFTEQRNYYLYMRCKDDIGEMTLGVIEFHVVGTGAEKNLAYIDDWRYYPKTSPHGEPLDDANWQRMLEGYDYGQGWGDLVWDEWDVPLGEEIPPLDFLLQFKALVWSINDNRAVPEADKSAWFQMNYTDTRNVLALYLGSETAGGQRGKAWVFGGGLVESTVLSYGGRGCGYPYAVLEDAPLVSCRIRERSFAFDYLHIRGDFDKYDLDSGGSRVNLFADVDDRCQYVYLNPDPLPIEGYVTPPAAELYPALPPRLEPDPAKRRAQVLRNFEVLEYPSPDSERQLLFYDAQTQEETGLIPLYKFRALTSNSKADGRFCGFRYIPKGALDHGDVVYFFFQMYAMRDDQARATAKVVLSDWFGLPDPDAFRR